MNEQENQTIHYDAFISYRHSELDKSIAQMLHKMLETYKVPKNIAKQVEKKKITRIFRDRDELPSSSNLADNITEALRQSEFLIVICSPRTPASQWVNKEIETFSQMHGHDKILALLVEGEPSESFPEALKYAKKQETDESGVLHETLIEYEPLAADIRASSKGAMKKLLKQEILRILAALLHCRYDDLKQRHRERLIKKVVLCSSLLTLFFALFGSFSLYQGFQIQKQMQKVLLTESRYLADVSERLLKEGDRKSAVLTAKEALPKNLSDPERPYVEEAEYALSRSLYTYKFDTKFVSDCALKHPAKVNFLKLNADGSLAVTSCQDGYLYIWDTASGTLLNKIRTSSPYLPQKDLYFLNNTDVVFLDASQMRCMSAKTAKTLWSIDDLYSDGITLSSDAARIAVAADSSLLLFDNQGKQLAAVPVSIDYNTYICDLKFNEDHSKLLAAQAGGNVSVIDTEKGSIISSFKTTYDSLLSAVFTEDNQIAVGSNQVNMDAAFNESKGILEVFDLNSGKCIHSITFDESAVSKLVYVKEESKLLLTEDEKVNVFDTKTYQKLASFIHGDEVTEYRLKDDILVTGSRDGTIRFWLLDSLTEYEPMRISYLDQIASLELNKGIIAATYFGSENAYLFRMLEGYDLIKLKGHTGTLKGGEFSFDDTKALTTAYSLGELMVWDVQNKKLLNQFTLDSEAMAAHFIGNTSLISAVTMNGTLVTLDPQSRQPVNETPVGEVNEVFYSADAGLAGMYTQNSLKVFDTKTHKVLLDVPSDTVSGKLFFSSDNTKLLTVSAGNINVLNIADKKSLYQQDNEDIDSAYFSPSGSLLALVKKDLTVQLINLKTQTAAAEIKDIILPIANITFSPDEKLILAGLSNNALTVYNAASGQLIKNLEPLDYQLTSCSFSKDQKYFVTFDGNNHAVLWDAKSYKKLSEIDYLFGINHTFTTFLTGYNTEAILMPRYTLPMLLKEAERQAGAQTLTDAEKEKLFITK